MLTVCFTEFYLSLIYVNCVLDLHQFSDYREETLTLNVTILFQVFCNRHSLATP